MDLWLVLTFLRLGNCDNKFSFPQYQAQKKGICSGIHNGLNMPDLRAVSQISGASEDEPRGQDLPMSSPHSDEILLDAA